MSDLAHLSEIEIETRYQVTGARPVAFLLAGYARERASFTVNFGDGDMFLTTLLGVDADQGRVYFDCSGSRETNQRLLAADKAAFSGRPDDIPVRFRAGPCREVSYEGGAAFSAPLPAYVVRLQRREYFRIDTPRGQPLVLAGRLPGSALVRWEIRNISVAGAAVEVPALPDGLAPGTGLSACHFPLPGDARELFCEAVIRHVTELPSRGGHRFWRIGLQFTGLAAGDEVRIQRYIARIERERHELTG